jgi:hypothetical protein
MIEASPLTFALQVGQRHRTSALRQWGRSRRRCRRSAPNVLLIGPPGAGTSMRARRLRPIRPATALAEATEITCLHRVAGRPQQAWRHRTPLEADPS